MPHAVTYRVVPSNPAAHMFTVTTTVHRPDPSGQVLRLPCWIPGSYLVREFAKNWVTIRAEGPDGPVALTKLDKDTWQAPPVDGPLVVTGEVYAWDLSVRMAHLDQTHGYFNGTSLFLEAVGQGDQPVQVELVPPSDPACADWRVATTLRRLDAPEHGFGVYEATDHDEAIDHPVELGTWDLATFEACGVPHEVAVTGRHSCDLDRLVADLKPICEMQIRMFGEPAPFDRYLFQVMVVGSGYGGLEHRSSTSLICSRADLPRAGVDEVTDGYEKFLGLCSHEYFHSWNVKRIKPAKFVPYDLTTESNTTLLWAFEGCTSYYESVGLVRSGRIDTKRYLQRIGRSLTRVFKGTGRLKQPVGESSFDAWTKFYRQDENAPNAIVSYYTKGALVALALDLTLLDGTDGAVGLDDVMRRLWADWLATGGAGVAEDGIERVAAEVSGLDLDAFFDHAIRGTEDLPLAALLAKVGVDFMLRPAKDQADLGGKPAKLKPRGDLGARVTGGGGDAKLASVFDGGAAQAAGLSAGDVVVALDGLRVTGSSLPKRIAEMAPGESAEVVAFRRDELMRFTITVQSPPATHAVLTLSDDADERALRLRRVWLEGTR